MGEAIFATGASVHQRATWVRNYIKFNKINWSQAIKYDGFSDHTLGIVAPILFTILKKQQKSKEIFIEKHTKLHTSRGPDASTSIDTQKLSELVSHIRILEKANF